MGEFTKLYTIFSVLVFVLSCREILSFTAVDDQFSIPVDSPICLSVLANDVIDAGATISSCTNGTGGFGTVYYKYPPFFLANTSTAVIEVENYHILNVRISPSYVSGADSNSWQFVGPSVYSDSSGTGSMRVWPNIGKNTGQVQYGPAIGYNVAFQSAGSYSMWVRGKNCFGCLDGLCSGCPTSTTADNDIHILSNSSAGDFVFVTNSSSVSAFSSAFAWVKNPALKTVDVQNPDIAWPPKLLQVYLAMKDDGVVLDKFYLSKDNLSPDSSQGSPQTTLVSCSSSEILYIPPKSTSGAETFTYTLSNGATSSTATVSVYVGTPLPTPSVTPSISSSPSTTPSASRTASPAGTPSSTPSISPSLSPSPSISCTPSITPSISSSPVPSASLTPSPNVTNTESSNNLLTSQNFIIGVVVAGVGFVFLCCCVAVVFLLVLRIRSNKKYNRSDWETDQSAVDLSDLKEDVYKPIAAPTLGSRGVIPQSWVIPFSELHMEKKIGHGAFGDVWKAKWKGVEVAVKKVTLGKQVSIEDFFAEAELMKTLKPHPNITQLMGVCTSPVCLITEYVHNGSLTAWIKEGKPMDKNLQMTIAKGIAAGMVYLHGEGVIHRDLAARNILLTQNLQPKVCDFGMSRIALDEAEQQKTTADIGPIRWMAPEALSERVYNTKTDVWSYGVVLYELLAREVPYKELSLAQVAGKVIGNSVSLVPEIEQAPRNTYPKVLVTIIAMCLQPDPFARPEFETILQLIEKQEHKRQRKHQHSIH